MRISRSLTPLTGHFLTLLTLLGLTVSLGAGSPPPKWQTAVEMLKLNRLFGNAPSNLLRRRLNGAAAAVFPRGSAQVVDGCKIYSASGNCLFCIRDSFLNATTSLCQSIPYVQLIPNCNIYYNATTCYQCDGGFVVSAAGGSCVPTVTLPNCAVQNQQGVCAQCVAGSFLSNGSCSPPIAGCANATSATACQTCAAGYYLSSSACVAVSANNIVSNCVSYSATQQCLACLKGFALDPNGQNCWNASQSSNQIDPNCENSVINTGQYCNICRQGYYLNNGTCTQVASDSSEGCFIADLTQPRNCLICLTGFQIDLTNTCSYAGLSNPGIVDPLGSAVILRAALALFLSLLLPSN